MADSSDIVAKISQALDAADQCAARETADSYSLLGEKLGDLETAAGQFLRSHSAYQFLVTKLQQDAPLTADDLKTLRALIVGDADEYLKYDDDFAQSKAQLGRVVEQIRQVKSADSSPEMLMRLRVLCREAASALTPTVHYLEQKERVQHFEENTRGPLSSDTRRMLSGIITGMAS